MGKHSSRTNETDRAVSSSAIAARAAANVERISEPVAGPRLYTSVRAGLMLQGLTFKAYCEQNAYTRQYVRECLLGNTNGPKAREIRRAFAEAAGV